MLQRAAVQPPPVARCTAACFACADFMPVFATIVLHRNVNLVFPECVMPDDAPLQNIDVAYGGAGGDAPRGVPVSAPYEGRPAYSHELWDRWATVQQYRHGCRLLA